MRAPALGLDQVLRRPNGKGLARPITQRDARLRFALVLVAKAASFPEHNCQSKAHSAAIWGILGLTTAEQDRHSFLPVHAIISVRFVCRRGRDASPSCILECISRYYSASCTVVVVRGRRKSHKPHECTVPPSVRKQPKWPPSTVSTFRFTPRWSSSR